MITGNVIGGILKYPDTIILRDEDGKEYAATMLGEEVELTATENDIRIGKVAANEKGVVTGEKVIPAYHTTQGYQIIPDKSSLVITSLKDLDKYDYTKLQVMICEFNSSLSDSVSVSKVVIDDNVYEVLSTISISEISKNETDKTIDLGIVNNSGNPQILRFLTYKEIP